MMTNDEKSKLSRKGLDVRLPEMDVFPNLFPGYRVTLSVPEYTSLCPKTGQPDFGTLTLAYVPGRWCVELKSFKLYIHAYRNVGISYENDVNRVLRDFVRACRPKWACLKGEFTPRGGIRSVVEAESGRRPKGFTRRSEVL